RRRYKFSMLRDLVVMRIVQKTLLITSKSSYQVMSSYIMTTILLREKIERYQIKTTKSCHLVHYLSCPILMLAIPREEMERYQITRTKGCLLVHSSLHQPS
ncbi:hypothetical protein PanWU01x14_348450, partial [Parasponia andersonii]